MRKLFLSCAIIGLTIFSNLALSRTITDCSASTNSDGEINKTCTCKHNNHINTAFLCTQWLISMCGQKPNGAINGDCSSTLGSTSCSNCGG